MEKTEIRKILKFINSIYPKSSLNSNDNDTVETWSEMLEEYSYDDVRNAVKVHAKSNPFVPTIAEIISKIAPSSSKIEIEVLGNDYAVYVRFPDSMFPFRFRKKETANKFIQMIKNSSPDINTVTDLFNKHIKERKGILREEPQQWQDSV